MFEAGTNIKTRWDTPISDCPGTDLCTLRLQPDMSLEVYVWAGGPGLPDIFCCFRWQTTLAFRNTTAFRLQFSLFGEDTRWNRLGDTVKIDKSFWVASAMESALVPLENEPTHYLIGTITNDVEVLAEVEPEVTVLSEAELKELGITRQTFIDVHVK